MTTLLQVQAHTVFVDKFVLLLQDQVQHFFDGIIAFLNKVPLKLKSYFDRLIDEVSEYVSANKGFKEEIKSEFPTSEEILLPEDFTLHVVDRIYWREAAAISSEQFLSFLEMEYTTLGMYPFFLDFEAVTKLIDAVVFIRIGNNEEIYQSKMILDRLKALTALQTVFGYTFAKGLDHILFAEEMEFILDSYGSKEAVIEHVEVILLELAQEEEVSDYHTTLKKIYSRLRKEELLMII